MTDQAWYWEPEWQQGEQEATEQINAGRTTYHPDVDDLFNSLRAPQHDT